MKSSRFFAGGGSDLPWERNTMKILMRFVLTILLALMEASVGAAGIEFLAFEPKALPAGIQTQGKIVAGARWRDRLGENLLVAAQTGGLPSRGPGCGADADPCQDAEVYAAHYLVRPGGVELLWKLTDFERNCPFDLYAGFLPDSLTITDLDGDGLAESTLLYKLSCRSDVSPARLKLILHEGKTKYAIRGTTRTYGVGGEKTVDPALYQIAPFQRFARERWNRFVHETEFQQF